MLVRRALFFLCAYKNKILNVLKNNIYGKKEEKREKNNRKKFW